MDYREHLDNLRDETIESASKALDYLDGNQKNHMEDLFDDEDKGIEEWRKRGFEVIVDNITKKIIERSALAYQDQPGRDIYLGGEDKDDNATDAYANILKEGEFTDATEHADQVARLLKLAIVLVQYNQYKNRLEFAVLNRSNCDVDIDWRTREIKSLLYTSGWIGPNNGQMFHYWDSEQVVDIEVTSDGYRAIDTTPHSYGIVPAVYYYDIRKPRIGFWPKEAWQELVLLNEQLNRFHTETAFAASFQKIGVWVSNCEIDDNQKIGPDAVVKIKNQHPDVPVYFEVKTPQVNLTEFVEWLQWLQETIADNWGVNLRVSGGGSADSGFKLVVEEIWSLETRAKRIKAAKGFERAIFEVIKIMSKVHNLGLAESATIKVDFEEPSLPVNEMEDWTIDKEKIALNLMSKVDRWRKENPDITPEEIDERIAEIEQYNTVKRKAPTFEGIAEENNEK